MRSLGVLPVRNLLRRKARYTLVAAGTALGVAVFFAVLVSSAATSRALTDDLKGSAGRADVIISPVGVFDGTLPAGTAAKVATLPDVARISSSFSFRTSMTVDRGSDQIAFVSGSDDRSLQDLNLESGRFAAPGKAEVVISRSLSRTLGVHVGQPIDLTVPGGVRPVVLVGLLRDSGAGLADQGLLARTSLTVAQTLDARPGAINGIAVQLTAGTSRAAWIAQARVRLGNAVDLVDASNLASGFKGFLAALNGALTLVSAIALFVGGFLIFLTFSLAVAERAQVHATLRALGALPRQVRRLVLTEAVFVALGAGAVGLVLGYGLAALSVGLTSHLLHLPTHHLGVPVGQAIASLLLAVIVSLVAAWLPGRRAARVSPVAAMREGQPVAERVRAPWVPAGLIAAGIVLGAGPFGQLLRELSLLVLLLGTVLLVPWLLRPLARLVGWATRRVGRRTGDIAVNHLVKERSRSAYTLALVMVVLAMILGAAASNQAMSHALNQVIDRQAAGGTDLSVFAPGAFDPAVGSRLASAPRIAATTPLRFGGTELSHGSRSRQIGVEIIDPATYFRVASFAWVDGSDDRARNALRNDKAVLLPDTVATALGVHRGERVQIRTFLGLEDFVVGATFASIGNGFSGNAVIGSRHLDLLGGGRPNAYLLKLTPGTNPEVARNTIRGLLFAQYRGVTVESAASIKAVARRQINGFFSIGYALLAVAGVIGMLGLANTLVVSVLVRRREIGMLRSTGMLRRQVRAMVLVEAETLAIVAYVLSLPLAALLASGIIQGQRVGLGFSEKFTYPWALVVPVGVITILLAWLASVLPARRAARLQPVTALRVD